MRLLIIILHVLLFNFSFSQNKNALNDISTIPEWSDSIHMNAADTVFWNKYPVDSNGYYIGKISRKNYLILFHLYKSNNEFQLALETCSKNLALPIDQVLVCAKQKIDSCIFLTNFGIYNNLIGVEQLKKEFECKELKDIRSPYNHIYLLIDESGHISPII